MRKGSIISIDHHYANRVQDFTTSSALLYHLLLSSLGSLISNYQFLKKFLTIAVLLSCEFLGLGYFYLIIFTTHCLLALKQFLQQTSEMHQQWWMRSDSYIREWEGSMKIVLYIQISVARSVLRTHLLSSCFMLIPFWFYLLAVCSCLAVWLCQVWFCLLSPIFWAGFRCFFRVQTSFGSSV